MSLREEIKPYIDSAGVIQNNDKGERSQNGLRWSSEYFLALHCRGELTNEDRIQFDNIIDSCTVRPGLLRRHPDTHFQLQEGWDDYIAVLNCALWVAPQRASEIFNWGRTHNWTFNNLNPGKFSLSAWFGRSPSFIAHCYFANKLEPPFYVKLAWCAIMIHSAYRSKKNQDGWWLAFHMVAASRYSESSLIHGVRDFWFKKLLASEPSTMGKILEDYLGFKHPTAEYFPLLKWTRTPA